MTRAIVSCHHYYQPYGHEFYDPIFQFFLNNLKKYADEYDKIYIISDTTENANLRYYDQYKKILPEIKEDLVLFMDDDMVVYQPGCIALAFKVAQIPNHVASIYDTCGTYTTDKLNGFNKFCPYWFCAEKNLLTKYLGVDWGPHMPESETLGYLTRAMLDDGVEPYEFQDDKSNILFNGTQDGEQGKNLGYYHIRAGSTPAWLLAEKQYGNSQAYWDYLKSQPKNEYLRQCAWYQYIGGNPMMIVRDTIGFNSQEKWDEYYKKFISYHNLP